MQNFGHKPLHSTSHQVEFPLPNIYHLRFPLDLDVSLEQEVNIFCIYILANSGKFLQIKLKTGLKMTPQHISMFFYCNTSTISLVFSCFFKK